MSNEAKELIYVLEQNGFIPFGLNMPISMVIEDIRACNYNYYGNKYASSNELFENSALSIKFKHNQVENPFWITIFKGANYREKETLFVAATFNEIIDENNNFCNSENTFYAKDCISKSNELFEGIESIKEVLAAFETTLFSGSEDSTPIFEDNSDALYDVIEELRSLLKEETLDADEIENLIYENKKMGDFLELLGFTPDDITTNIINGSEDELKQLVKDMKLSKDCLKQVNCRQKSYDTSM
ncbi:hypothetical protein CP985_11810 [Malaciobacter mytili LMG 24559]|uniref:Uncharacterized protein n=1 Tax=Malaciobacter mytili LMG 24559 TaxID=1032238 RepID=A0AAX2AD34_9BACT|nr:hypothetical protein [Malaciobacter mytili]AXH16351.1 hypothetical protein AMYT_a0051 [Malaciobacter mytili LMG 24559]RXK14798.1 hypothetical protein CP985_11810 [Malaciobacter mytili LMG 24559]